MIEQIDSSYILPSSPEDRKKIKAALQEMTNSMVRIDSEKEQLKSIVDRLNDEFKVPKRLSTKVAKVMHKTNFDKVSSEEDAFRIFYEEIVDKVVVPKIPALNSQEEKED